MTAEIDVTQYEPLATGRHSSLFEADWESSKTVLADRFCERRVAVIGAAGSIGSAVVKELIRFLPRSLVLFDLNENSLVEIVRDLRSSPGLKLPDQLEELPIGLGTMEFLRYFRETERFDYILNLSAMKHVRSEKNVYCLMRMVDTNVLFLDDFINALPEPCAKFFSVSSDKAVSPANLMGATKMVMEKVLFLRSVRQPFSTARFANVAFSNGSLAHGFLQRIQKRQPLAAPRDIKRYFISHAEAATLCLFACALGNNADVFFPKPESLVEFTFPEIAEALLRSLGYVPHLCCSEEEARAKAREMIPHKRWPCYFSTSDTSGEKPFEAFVAEGDTVDNSRFISMGVVQQSVRCSAAEVEAFLAFAREARTSLIFICVEVPEPV